MRLHDRDDAARAAVGLARRAQDGGDLDGDGIDFTPLTLAIDDDEPATLAVEPEAPAGTAWEIVFQPHADMYAKANEAATDANDAAPVTNTR